MKTGHGLYKKYRLIVSYFNLFRFNFRKILIGFDYANQFIKRTDKFSVQLILQKNGATIGENCDIETGLTFHNCKKDYSNLLIGDNCHIGKNCFFDLRDKVEIGNNVVISMQSTFITHIDMTKSKLSKVYPAISKKITIGDDCYIGANSTILMGVSINKYVFIAASSLVNKDVPPYTMVGGVPAREIKRMKKL